MIEIRNTEMADAARIVKNLRKFEKKAVELLNVDPTYLLQEEIGKSVYCFTGLADGEVGVIWGVKPPSFMSDTAYLWAITTPLVEEHPFVFLRHSRQFVEAVGKMYPIMTGFVLAENTRSIKWLRWLGFKVGHPVTHNGMRVRQFERRA